MEEENNLSKSFLADFEAACQSEDIISQASQGTETSQDTQDSRMDDDSECAKDSGFTEECATKIGRLALMTPPLNRGMLYSLSLILGNRVRLTK